jgi:non-specific serine/threonine protein kinase
MDFFRNEFANPIDKFGEQEQKEHLRKLYTHLFCGAPKNRLQKICRKKQKLFCFAKWKLSKENL